MTDIKRITGNDGRLLGFNINGHIVERDDTMATNELTTRKLEVELLNRLLVIECDTESPVALQMIEWDDERIKGLKKPLQ